MKVLPSLDAHAHINPSKKPEELTESGAVLAMTLSLEEASFAVSRHDTQIAWGVGCHPRKLKAQRAFNAEQFRKLAEQTAIVGEIGLDIGSHYAHASFETQQKNFREALGIVADLPRIVSIHSYQATKLVIRELQRTPIAVPILHWWTGNVEETQKAVALGCYFSVHSAVARHSKFRTTVPRERILLESDHGYADPPAAIPCRIEWVEHLVANQLELNVKDVRRLAWQNLATMVHDTHTLELLPKSFAAIIKEVSNNSEYQMHF